MKGAKNDEFFRLNLHERNENVPCPSDILDSRRLNGSFRDIHLNFSAQESIYFFTPSSLALEVLLFKEIICNIFYAGKLLE